MRYLIIGLGIYGTNLARDLTDMGHEVIGADINAANVEAIKDYIATAYIIDAADEASLAVLPVKNVDLVIIAIGENFGASIKALALMKKMGVPHIYARAIDPLHEAILQNFDIDRILTPEQRAARDLSAEMAIGSRVASLRIDSTHLIVRFTAPPQLVGTPYADLRLGDLYSLTLIAATRPTEREGLLHLSHSQAKVLSLDLPGLKVESEDVLTVYGEDKCLRRFYKHLNL